MKKITSGPALVLLVLLLCLGACRSRSKKPRPPTPVPTDDIPPPLPPKYLIYAGWFGNTIPTPAYIRDHHAFLETQPFDGLAIYLRNPDLTVNASTRVMTNTPISSAQISSVLSPLQGLTFTKLTQNFGLVFGNTPPDFFDDWTIPTQNFSNLARAVKDAGLKGIFFDNEQYFSPWGNYPSGTRYGGVKPLAEYQEQARLRGRQVMEAMVAQFPEIVVLTLHGPYISDPQAPSPLFPQWQSSNELLGPFFAGFVEGRGSGTAVDGGELYHLRSATQFADSYAWRNARWPGASIGFGLYDKPFAGADMNSTIMTTTVTRALQQADRWVWLYVEGPTFLKPPSEGGASQTWVDAVRQGLDASRGAK